MQSEPPPTHLQPQLQDVGHRSGTPCAFHGFRPLVANFTQSPNEIVDLKLPGLTSDLRWTLHVLARETVGDAYQRGGSPYDFKAISWARWMDLLELRSINAVKARLARLEELGLIEVQPREGGVRGALANRYRLRWANDGQAASRIFHAALRDRSLQMARKRSAREEVRQPADNCQPGMYQPADNCQFENCQPADSCQPDIPSSGFSTSVLSLSASQSSIEQSRPKKQADVQAEQAGTDSKNKKENQPASLPAAARIAVPAEIPSADTTADRQDGNNSQISLDLNLKHFLKGMGSGPWPELLLTELEKILSKHQVSVIEGRSPWSAEGAWTILEAIRVRQDLDHKAATLWNALLKPDKGARYLAEAGAWVLQPRKASGDGITWTTGAGSMGGELEAREQGGRAPLHGEAQESNQGRPGDGHRGASETAIRDNNAPLETKEWMMRQSEAQMKRPEDFSPQVKAQLRILIENVRHAFRHFQQAPKEEQTRALDAFARAFKCAADALEPVLPVLVVLPDEYHQTEIRQRSQIKTCVLRAVYQAIS